MTPRNVTVVCQFEEGGMIIHDIFRSRAIAGRARARLVSERAHSTCTLIDGWCRTRRAKRLAGRRVNRTGLQRRKSLRILERTDAVCWRLCCRHFPHYGKLTTSENVASVTNRIVVIMLPPDGIR